MLRVGSSHWGFLVLRMQRRSGMKYSTADHSISPLEEILLSENAVKADNDGQKHEHPKNSSEPYVKHSSKPYVKNPREQTQEKSALFKRYETIKHEAVRKSFNNDNSSSSETSKQLPVDQEGKDLPNDLEQSQYIKRTSRDYTTEVDPDLLFVRKLNSEQVVYEPVIPSFKQPEVPRLAHNLSRVLFEPNVYHQLQDTRSRVYNFTPFLKNVMPVEEFDFNKINGFIPAGKDKVLLGIAKEFNNGSIAAVANANSENSKESSQKSEDNGSRQDFGQKLKRSSRKVNKSKKAREILKKTSKSEKIKFYGSTSSMTGLLCHLHYLLSNWRYPSFSKLSSTYNSSQSGFTVGAKCATSVIVNLRDIDPETGHTVYSIDSDKSTDSDIILSILGHSLEKLLVTNEEEFMKKYKLQTSAPIASTIKDLVESGLTDAEPAEEKEPETYHYAKVGKFLVRSQLDCHDPRLPNTGVFDLKTRAVCAVRADLKYVQNEQNNKTGYQILKRFGQFESHEREKYDLIRSTMLKYSFQARIGNMDGIFICYHNIEKIFGFEYVPVSEMDEIFHSDIDSEPENAKALLDKDFSGQEASLCSYVAEKEFTFSFKILEDIVSLLIERYMPQVTKKGGSKSFRMILKCKVSDDKTSKLYVLFAPLTEDQVSRINDVGVVKDKLLVEENLTDSTDLTDSHDLFDLPQEITEDNEAETDITTLEEDQNVAVKRKLDPVYYQIKEKLQKKEFYKINRATSKHVKGFVVTVEHYFDGALLSQPHPFPKSKDELWNIKYFFDKLPGEVAQSLYNKFLREKAAVSWTERDSKNEFISTLRQYGKLGRKREEYWNKIDSDGNVVWTPDS